MQEEADFFNFSRLLLLTREKFAEQVGLTAKTVYAMCDRGYLPVVRLGRRVFINLVALRQVCEDAQPFAHEAGSGCPQLGEDGLSQRKAAPQARPLGKHGESFFPLRKI